MEDTLTAVLMTYESANGKSLGSAKAGCDFVNLVVIHRTVLMKRALVLAGNRCDAEDLVQETFARALQKFPIISTQCNYRAWLIKILINLYIDEYRRQQRSPRALPITPELPVVAPKPEPPPTWAKVSSEQLEAAVATLDSGFRNVYILSARENRSYDEIAKILGISKSTVGTRLHRARRKLKSLLTEKCL
jgi:RNA polymerase sigma-70 factor (ECF subfamily)